MNKKKKKTEKNETLNNDYYYRDQEMMRPIIESEPKEKDEDIKPIRRRARNSSISII